LLLLYNENEKLENDDFEEKQKKKKWEMMVDEMIYSEILSIISFLSSSCQENQENSNKYFVKLSLNLSYYFLPNDQNDILSKMKDYLDIISISSSSSSTNMKNQNLINEIYDNLIFQLIKFENFLRDEKRDRYKK